MDFVLKYCNGAAAGEQKIANPSPEVIEQAINDLLPVIYYYMVLEAEVPANDYKYIQTLIIQNGDTPELEYLVETQKIVGDDFAQYRKHTKDVGEVKKLFRMFALERPPDITGWEDVTKEIKALSKKEGQGQDGQPL